MREARSLTQPGGWAQLDSGLAKQSVHGTRMTVTLYSFPPGTRFDEHTHPQEQISFVVEGELSFIVEGRRHDLRANDVIVIDGGAAHSAIAGPPGAKVYSVVSPRRDDSEIRMA